MKAKKPRNTETYSQLKNIYDALNIAFIGAEVDLVSLTGVVHDYINNDRWVNSHYLCNTRKNSRRLAAYSLRLPRTATSYSKSVRLRCYHRRRNNTAENLEWKNTLWTGFGRER